MLSKSLWAFLVLFGLTFESQAGTLVGQDAESLFKSLRSESLDSADGRFSVKSAMGVRCLFLQGTFACRYQSPSSNGLQFLHQHGSEGRYLMASLVLAGAKYNDLGDTAIAEAEYVVCSQSKRNGYTSCSLTPVAHKR